MIDCPQTLTRLCLHPHTHTLILVYFAVQCVGGKKALNYSQLYNGTFTLEQTSVELFSRLTERPNGLNMKTALRISSSPA